MPLRHVGNIVIWEGNYSPDIIYIGRTVGFFNKLLIKRIKNKKTGDTGGISRISTFEKPA
jgi:hypothetical protein